MNINYNFTTNKTFYESEIQRALEWLYKIRDDNKFGWAWVQFIQPNEQNTAEVIHTFAENEEWIKDNPEVIPKLIESINYWLLDTTHPTISIDYCWVLKALQKLRQCNTLYSKLDSRAFRTAVNFCVKWICDNFIDVDGYGWNDNSSEMLNVIRTSLSIICLNEEITHMQSHRNSENKIQKLQQIVESAIEWLIGIQNDDGGWGNIDTKYIDQNYQRNHDFTIEDLHYQCDSNAASTGYAMLALASNSKFKKRYSYNVKKAFNYLVAAQNNDGGWSVFTEVGMRNGERYTFRHFSTTWALQGIIVNNAGDYRNECVIHGFEYLSKLQDDNYGGWKSSPDADNYTWATCNALSTIRLLKDSLSDVHAEYFLNIVWDWWTLKKKEANYSIEIRNTTLAFNGPMALVFCIVFSLMITMLLYILIGAISPMVADTSETFRKMVFSIITVMCAVILGLPWIVYVNSRFKEEVGGLINSIGWVYGIITGFVLVLYQFFI